MLSANPSAVDENLNNSDSPSSPGMVEDSLESGFLFDLDPSLLLANSLLDFESEEFTEIYESLTGGEKELKFFKNEEYFDMCFETNTKDNNKESEDSLPTDDNDNSLSTNDDNNNNEFNKPKENIDVNLQSTIIATLDKVLNSQECGEILPIGIASSDNNNGKWNRYLKNEDFESSSPIESVQWWQVMPGYYIPFIHEVEVPQGTCNNNMSNRMTDDDDDDHHHSESIEKLTISMQKPLHSSSLGNGNHFQKPLSMKSLNNRSLLVSRSPKVASRSLLRKNSQQLSKTPASVRPETPQSQSECEDDYNVVPMVHASQITGQVIPSMYLKRLHPEVQKQKRPFVHPIDNDHRYHRSPKRFDNLGVETPSESDHNIPTQQNHKPSDYSFEEVSSEFSIEVTLCGNIPKNQTHKPSDNSFVEVPSELIIEDTVCDNIVETNQDLINNTNEDLINNTNEVILTNIRPTEKLCDNNFVEFYSISKIIKEGDSYKLIKADNSYQILKINGSYKLFVKRRTSEIKTSNIPKNEPCSNIPKTEPYSNIPKTEPYSNIPHKNDYSSYLLKNDPYLWTSSILPKKKPEIEPFNLNEIEPSNHPEFDPFCINLSEEVIDEEVFKEFSDEKVLLNYLFNEKDLLNYVPMEDDLFNKKDNILPNEEENNIPNEENNNIPNEENNNIPNEENNNIPNEENNNFPNKENNNFPNEENKPFFRHEKILENFLSESPRFDLKPKRQRGRPRKNPVSPYHLKKDPYSCSPPNFPYIPKKDPDSYIAPKNPCSYIPHKTPYPYIPPKSPKNEPFNHDEIDLSEEVIDEEVFKEFSNEKVLLNYLFKGVDLLNYVPMEEGLFNKKDNNLPNEEKNNFISENLISESPRFDLKLKRARGRPRKNDISNVELTKNKKASGRGRPIGRPKKNVESSELNSKEEVDVVSLPTKAAPHPSFTYRGASVTEALLLPNNPTPTFRHHLEMKMENAIEGRTRKTNDDSLTHEYNLNKIDEEPEPVQRRTRKNAKRLSVDMYEDEELVKSHAGRKRARTASSVNTPTTSSTKRTKPQYHHRVTHQPKTTRRRKALGDEPDSCERRNLHNNMERQRRIDLRNLVDELRQLLPGLSGKGRSPKILVLDEARRVCLHMTSERIRLQNLEAELKAEQDILLETVSTLRKQNFQKIRLRKNLGI